MQKHHWINDSIEINFPLPSSMLYLIEEAEKLDEAEDYAYFNYVDALDDAAKELFKCGVLSKAQWNLLFKKYLGE